MFGPRDPVQPIIKVSSTFRHVYEGGKHYVVFSFGADKDDWQKIEITRRQAAGFIEDALPRVLVK